MNFNFLKKFEGVAIVSNQISHTYLDLYDKINFYGEYLNQFNESIIAIVADFNFETIALLLASCNSSKSIVPIVYTTESEYNLKIKTSNVELIIRYKNSIIETERISSNKQNLSQPGLLLFSSGTTGVPKMMVHTFSKLFNVLEKPSQRQRKLRILLFLMFDHIGGINTMLSCLKEGSTIIIPNERTPDHVLELIYKFQVNVLPTTPTFLNMIMLNENLNIKKLDSLKLISYGTERMPDQLLKKLKESLPMTKLLQTFGTSETGILKTVSKSSDSLYFKIEDERYQYKIVDNILFIKSHLNINGYLNSDNTKFDKDGWYNTGDIVNTDNEGYITIIGRINEVINVGGLKVMPNEIEGVILQIDWIKDCLVYSLNNSITGQMVAIKVVIDKTICQNISEIELKKQIKGFCKQHLDKYKIPAKIEFTDKLDHTSRFKKSIS